MYQSLFLYFFYDCSGKKKIKITFFFCFYTWLFNFELKLSIYSTTNFCSKNFYYLLPQFIQLYFLFIYSKEQLPLVYHVNLQGFPGSTSGKEPTCQCRRHKRCEFSPWVGKIIQRRAWQPTPVFLRIPWTEDPGGLHSGGKELNMTKVTQHIHRHTRSSLKIYHMNI